MDPALQEQLLPELDQSEEIEAIIRLTQKGIYPAGIRVIVEFGDIITCRVKRQNIVSVYNDVSVKSFKAARVLQSDGGYLESEELRISQASELENFDFNLQESASIATGKYTYVAVLDWGGDFAHQDFLNTDGTTRFHAIWDQGYTNNTQSPTPYGYGKLYTQKMMNAALKTAAPYKSLGYHPGKTDRTSQGMHGTHVLGIAASNGRSGKKGVAPECKIIFVHLATESDDPHANLGDSVRLLEAIHFAHRVAGDSPLVINLSVGRHGGSHDGKSLVELGMDQFLLLNQNRVICQSTGNYYNNQTHTAGVIFPGRSKSFAINTTPNDATDNELEIWYEAVDQFGISIEQKATGILTSCSIDHKDDIVYNGNVVGRVYHRSKEPNNGKNHIDIFLYKQAPSGVWNVKLTGEKITDGRFHSWIERDSPAMQSRFLAADIIPSSSTGTICNGLYTIAVGAADTTVSPAQIAAFSSCGPTVDGRYKPNILAPGINIVSAKSSPSNQKAGGKATVSMQGTSMASPYVAGAVALLLQVINKPVDIHAIRRILLSSAAFDAVSHIDVMRKGSGIIDVNNLIRTTLVYNANQLAFENFNAEAEEDLSSINYENSLMSEYVEILQEITNECAA